MKSLYFIFFLSIVSVGVALAQTPTITSFSPGSGPVGTPVTITGTNFSAITTNNTVKFNGTVATVTASTATSITTSVPSGATTGTITVTVGSSTATSSASFTVTAAGTPSIASFNPTNGPVGTTVIITGTNFSTTAANNTVSFNGTAAVVTASTATSITTSVPSGATSGIIFVTVSGLTGTSSTSYTVTTAGTPTITNFSPTGGPVGTVVTITGTNFSTTAASNSVKFNGTAATVTASTATSITTSVPSGATSGTISVTVTALTGTSALSFSVLPAGTPTVTSFNPTNGPVGTIVTITGTNFSSTPANNTVSFNGTAATVTASTATSITTSVPLGATTGNITVTVASLTGASSTSYTVTAAGTPTITSFSPTSAPPGTTVTITGTNFSTTAASNTVSFNGTAATVTASTATSITTSVPAGATSGTISVTVTALTGTSALSFTVLAAGTPTITSFSPTSGPVGTPFTITGTNFSTTAANNTVALNGTAATVTASTATSINTSVPSGATTGNITVTVASLTGTSSTSFTVTGPTPTITSFNPVSGPVGTSVVITGTNFSTTPANNAVSFNGTAATVTASTATTITTSVPTGATSGTITVTVGGVTGTSSSSFNVTAASAPSIANVSPSSGIVGATVTITGTNFSTTPANNAVSFNGTAATVTASTATSITTSVPSGATSGTITVTVAGLTGTSSGNFTVITPTAQGVFFKAGGTIGGTLTDYIQTTAIDASGNVYIAGGFSSTVNFNSNGTAVNLTSLGGLDAFFAKYSSTGSLLWVDQIGSSGDDQVYDMTVDASGNVYVTGYFSGTADFDPGIGVTNFTSNGGGDIFYGKYSSTGAYTWAAANGSTGTDMGTAIKVDGSGNVYLTGFFNNTVDFDPSPGTNSKVSAGSDDIFLMLVGGTGSAPTLTWVESYGSTLSDQAYGLDLDNSNVYLSGYYSGTINFGPGTSTSSATNLGGKDAFFAKYATTSGLLQWWATARSSGDDYATSIVVSGTNFYVAGAFSSSASFYSLSGNVTKNSNGGLDIFVAKYDGSTSTPTLTWANGMGGPSDDASNLLAVDASGNAYSTGFFQGTANFDPNGTTTLVSAGGQDVYLASYASSSGALRISNRIGGTSDDEGTSIAVDASNNIYLAGYFQGTASLDFTSSAQDKTSAGLTDGFLAIYGQATSTTTTLSITNTSYPATYDAGGSLTVSITVSDHTLVSSMQFNSLGISKPYTVSSVTSQILTPTGNTYSVTLPPSSLTDPIGTIYYFRMIDTKNDTTFTPDTSTQFGVEAYLHYPSTATSQAIPGLVFGAQASNYQIVAVPLTLTNPSVTNVFSALGAYDNTKWRLFDYTNGDNREYPGFSTIVPGKGYWLISRNSVTINPGDGTTVQADHDTPYIIALNPGWNLIGNPFNFKLSWKDIVTNNNNAPGISDNRNWKMFTAGALTTSDILSPYRGAFVFNSLATTFNLNISATRNTTLGRESGHQDQLATNSLDQAHWEVSLRLSDGDLSNELGGIGMDPQATLVGKDHFDEVSVPVPDGVGLFEMAYPHPELHAVFNKEFVPTQENFTWNFDVKRPGESSSIALKWDNSYFGNNDKRLVVFDPTTLQLTDMRIADHYNLNGATKSLRFLFGSNEYIQHELNNELPWLGSPYPNPAIGSVTIPFRVPESKDQMPVMINVYDSKGALVATPVNQSMNSGSYEVKWGSGAGIYLVRMNIGSQATKTAKVIIN